MTAAVAMEVPRRAGSCNLGMGRRTRPEGDGSSATGGAGGGRRNAARAAAPALER